MISEEDLESDSPTVDTTAIVSPQPSVSSGTIVPPANIDKINNLVQKESALARAGVSRYKYMLVIAEALEAVHWVDESDEQGNVKRVLRPHVARRQWGAEQAARLYGDMIERKEIEHDLGDKTLDRFRSLSVAELRAKAAEILQGRVIDIPANQSRISKDA